MQTELVKKNFMNSSNWVRLLFIAIFFAGISILFFPTLLILVILQFFTLLVTGQTNGKLNHIGETFSRYVYQILLFLTFSTDTRPYPFDNNIEEGDIVEDS